MDDDQQNEQYGLIAWVLGIAVTIAIAVSLVIGIVGAMSKPGSTAKAGAAAPTAVAAPPAAAPTTPPASAGSQPAAAAAAPVAAAPAADAAGGVIAKVYFASASAELPPEAGDALKAVAAATSGAPGKKAVISGFHDRTGDPERNIELAKQRAFAVRDRLASYGLAEAQVELRKPQETTGDGNEREARRVEVRVE